MKKLGLSLVLGAALSSSVWAVPFLQLDIKGGTYDTSSETVFNTTNAFELCALVDTTSSKYVAGTTYWLSIAIVPQVTTDPGAAFGTFEFDGTTYDSGDMMYGIPPSVDPVSNQGGGPGNLGSHDIFETYFLEVTFTSFDGMAKEYNSMDNPGGLVTDPLGTLAYACFNVDVSNLGDGYGIHFDLFTVGSDNRLKEFAPFSHDAQGNKVPDGGATVMLLGMALVGLGAVRQLKKI